MSLALEHAINFKQTILYLFKITFSEEKYYITLFLFRILMRIRLDGQYGFQELLMLAIFYSPLHPPPISSSTLQNTVDYKVNGLILTAVAAIRKFKKKQLEITYPSPKIHAR